MTSTDPWVKFRSEVQDKLHVVMNLDNCSPVHRQIVFRQCEDFLVELAQKICDERKAVALKWRTCPNCGGGPLVPETAETQAVYEAAGFSGVYCKECRDTDTYLRERIDRLTAGLNVASKELWATYGDTERVRPIFEQMDAAREE